MGKGLAQETVFAGAAQLGFDLNPDGNTRTSEGKRIVRSALPAFHLEREAFFPRSSDFRHEDPASTVSTKNIHRVRYALARPHDPSRFNPHLPAKRGEPLKKIPPRRESAWIRFWAVHRPSNIRILRRYKPSRQEILTLSRYRARPPPHPETHLLGSSSEPPPSWLRFVPPPPRRHRQTMR